MKRLLPLLLFLVVLSSGCTVPILNIEIPGLPDIPGFGPRVDEGKHDVLIIKSFEAIPTEIDEGQTTRLIAYVQNIGDKIVGEGGVEVEMASEGIEIDLYDYCHGLFAPRVDICRGTPDGSTKCKLEKLLPGEITQVSWVLSQAGNVKGLRTVCPPDGIKMSVRYPYKTSSLTTISFISKGELERTLEQREFTSVESYVKTGQGPIKPYLLVKDKQPIPVYKGDTSDESARTVLELKLKNMGSGYLDSKFDDEDGVKIVGLTGGKITVTGLDSSADIRPVDPPENNCKFASTAWGDEKIKLIGKESPPYLCKVDLSKLVDKVPKRGSRHFEVSVEYEYLVTRAVVVIINPKIAA